MTRQEEQILVAQAQANPQQFDALYRSFIDEIYRFVFYKTNSTPAAEDTTAQVFLHALEHLASFQYQAGARFSSWLYTIARNQVIDYYRKQKPAASIDDIEPTPQAETASAATDQALEQARVQRLLKLLPADDQEILTLRLWEDKSYAEIGRILKLNAVVMRARYSRALEKFKKLYDEHYGSSQ